MNHPILAVTLCLLLALPAGAATPDEHDHAGHDHHHQHEGDDDHQHDHADHDHDHEHDAHEHVADSVAERMAPTDRASQYTCPMHPQIVRDEPGRCPICGMALVERERHDGDDIQISIAPALQQAMNVRTAEVQHGRLWRRIDTLGRLQVDESTIHHLHPRVEGWINDLTVTSVGDRVEAGQQLFTLYSPDLVNVQDEYLRAIRSGREDTIRAARQRLEVLDVSAEVIERIRQRGEPMLYLPWYARHDGYITQLNVRHGMYVTPGMEMIEMADPTTVWLIAEVFTGQVEWLNEGQRVDLNLKTDPGETLTGRIDFIYPQLDSTTRTARVRVVLDNPDEKLRPGDWASVAIFAGPRDHLNYVPTEAIIRTGQSERVVVRDDERHFSVREVHAGMESGEFTEIRHGLDPGEEVVVSGQFLIDSEANIRAGHNRMGGAHDH
jgi:membrane fusion protein, copper/silver efflux system